MADADADRDASLLLDMLLAARDARVASERLGSLIAALESLLPKEDETE
jgi:hypothetical protein